MPLRTDRKSVLIVSRNAETAQHLRLYFESRGLLVDVAASLGEEIGASAHMAFVVFPDELTKSESEQRLLALVRQKRKTKVIVITADTQRYADLVTRPGEARSKRVIVLPRPAFSWTIFDYVVTPLDEPDNPRGL
ncbi:MAG: hypothetical protein QM784_33825 [Polyangiaceae bacterium]